MRLARYEQTKAAVGGYLTMGIVGEWDDTEANSLYDALWLEVFRFEKQFSRFIESSELAFVNRRAGLETPVSEDMLSILNRARAFAETTDGLYNPFILPALQRNGYLKSAAVGYQYDDTPDYTSRQVVSPSEMQLSLASLKIPHLSALDLGGIGKGYLADQLAQTLHQHDARGFWVDVSGDVATYGRDENEEHLRVAIQDSDDVIICPETPLGIATSGTYVRHGAKSGTSSHHIIDPRTGGSATTDISLATVLANDTTTADILASCAIIVGADSAPEWLAAHGASSWRLVTEQGIIQSGAVFIHQHAKEGDHA